MLMLSIEGWLNGLTAVGIFVIGWILGLFFIYQSRQTSAKLLKYIGLLFIFSVNPYWGVSIDFITILLTGSILYPFPSADENLRNFFVFGWAPFIFVTSFYIGIELLIPEKKWYPISLTIILAILQEFFFLIDINGSITMVYHKEDIALAHFTFGTPVFIIELILILSSFFCNVGGSLFKATQSTGIIRKKFILLSISFFFFAVFLTIEGLISEITILVFTRIGLIISFWIMYLGLREEPEKPSKPIKKQIKVEGDLFRISKRPDEITEEEVTYYKEQEICLVCKGKASKFTYICPQCRALYCANCAEALANLENQCWACNAPIDESKPVKPFQKEEEEIKTAIEKENSLEKVKSKKK